jgi:hypothetical protein
LDGHWQSHVLSCSTLINSTFSPLTVFVSLNVPWN